MNVPNLSFERREKKLHLWQSRVEIEDYSSIASLNSYKNAEAPITELPLRAGVILPL